MKKLSETYRKNGYDFSLVERIGDIAIYSQSHEGKVIAYEVFEVQKYPDRMIGGAAIAASEATPSNEQWGTKGYTFGDFSKAKIRAAEMFAAGQARKLVKRHRSGGRFAA